MPDVPNVPIPGVPIPGGDSKAAPLFNFKFDNASSNFVTGPTTFNTDPALYEMDKVALQSGATNMWNSFIQGINQTQISSEQYGLFNNQKRIADIEGGTSFRGELADLDSQHLNKQIDDIDYQTRKNELNKELKSLYNNNTSIQNDIFKDQDDISNNPVGKRYQMKEQAVQAQGKDAGLLDSIIYTQPSVTGSSAATMGATMLTAFGANAFKKIVGRVAATFVPEPAAPYVAAGVALGTMFETLYQARALESQSEVGGQISQDFDQLKADYLNKTGKTDLTKQEYNELITQAHKGADTQYWKNMSLAAVDAAQAMLLSGSVGKWFEALSNTNKITRFGTKALELWLEGKSESVEEGVQYAFQKEKQAIALGNKPNDPNGFWKTVGNAKFIKSLGTDYVDTLASLNYGPIKGNGKYSGDKEFEFSTESGFLMGVLMGGATTSVQVGKDIYNYRKAVNILQKAGVESADGNIFKFKSDIYKQFFTPSTGLFGLTGTESEDKVHYLKEAIKTLGKRKDGTGNTILTQDEVKEELQNVNHAFHLYDKLSGYLDNLYSSFNTDKSKLFNFAKAKFEDAAFRESMQTMFHNDKLDKAESNHMDAIAEDATPDSDLKASKIMLETIDNRIKRINGMQVGDDIRDRKIKFLEDQRKQIENNIVQQQTDFDSLGVNASSSVSPTISSASEDLLTAKMFKAETDTRYNNLFKVKNSKQLISWLNKTATEEAQNGWTEANEAISAIKQEEYKTNLEERKMKPFSVLTDDEKTDRTDANKKLLKAEGFTDQHIDSLNEQELENTANNILDSNAKGNLYIDEKTFTNKLANVKTQQEYESLYDIPGFKGFVDNTYPDLTQTSKIEDVIKAAQAKQKSDTISRKPAPAKIPNVGSIGRPKSSTDTRTEATLLSNIKAKDNKANIKNVLTYVKNSSYATEAEKELASKLLATNDKILEKDIKIDSNQVGPGQYGVKTDQVTVNLQYAADDYEDSMVPFETLVLHELLHQFTVKSFKLAENHELFNNLNNLYEFVIRQASYKNVTPKFYGLSSVDEMITEAFTNPEFQEYLKGIAYQQVQKTAWDVFMDLINSALKALGINTDRTALDEVIGLTTTVIDRRGRESFSTITDRVGVQLSNNILESNTQDQNIEAAADIFKDIYDIPNLLPGEFTNLEAQVNNFLNRTNVAIQASDKNRIVFGPFSFVPGNFLVTKDKKTIFTIDKKNPDGSILVTYTYKPQGSATAKIGSRVISDPNDVDQVFDDKSLALDYVKGKTPVIKPTITSKTAALTTAPEVDDFARTLNTLINYTSDTVQYGALDPKLLGIVYSFMVEASQAGHKNFSAISAEIIKRTNEATYKGIFENLRKTYVANFADVSKLFGLNDTPQQLMGLISGNTTAASIITGLQDVPPIVNNEYTGSTATDSEEQKLLAANIQDKVSGNVMKSTGQQFITDKNGLWTNQEDTDPVKQRYYNFIDRMSRETSNGKTMAELGYFGLLVQDAETLPDGTVIPHEQNTLDYINKFKVEGKTPAYGQIVMIVDTDNKPIKMNQNGEIDGSGDLVVFNIESINTVADKNIEVVARVNGITEPQAKVLIASAAAEMQRIRTAAKGGYPIVLELSTKPGVPIFTEQGQSTSPLAKNNYEIEIATVKKDDTSIGYFVNHPNNTGYLGGAYVFVNGVPVKIEPNQVSSATADLVVAILDGQVNTGLTIDELKERSKFLNNLIYQNYSKEKPMGTFYFRDSDVYVDGHRVAPTVRKEMIIKYGKYNIVSTLLNNNWVPYTINATGTIVKSAPSSYNEFLLNRSTTKAVIRDGNKVLANSYFNFKPGKSITNWAQTQTSKTEVKPAIKVAPVITGSVLSENYLTQNPKGDKIITIDDFLANIDWEETGIGGFEDYVEGALQMRLIKVDIRNDGSRTAMIYFDRGSGPSSGSAKHSVDLKPIQIIKSEPIEKIRSTVKQVEVTPGEIERKRRALFEKEYADSLRPYDEAVIYAKKGGDLSNIQSAITEREMYLDNLIKNGVFSDDINERFNKALSSIKAVESAPPNSLEAKKAVAKEKLRQQNEKTKDSDQYKQGNDIIFYGQMATGINDTIGNNLFNATQSITVVKSMDRIIYDFIHTYDKSIVDVFSQPKIVEAAYKYAYRVFADQLVNLNTDYEAKIDAAETEEDLNLLTDSLAQQSDKFNKVIKNWNDIVAYHQTHSKTFIIRGETIYFTYDEEGNIKEENDDSKTEKPKNSFDAVQGNEISSIDGANKETKALVRGLAKQTFNEFGIRELVDFGATWNNLAINLAGILEYDQMLGKLEKLSTTFPEYIELLDKLQTSKAKDTLTHNQISQIAKFRQDFSKPYIGVYETVFDPITEGYKVLEATKNNISAIEESYLNNFSTSNSNAYIQKDPYGTNILTPEIKNLKIDSLADKVLFLRAIGIKISEGTIRDPKVSSVISGKAIAAMKNSLVTLVENGVPVVNPLGQLRQPNKALNLPGESGNIDAILKLESAYNRNNASASMLNAEGSTVYALALNNFLTVSNYYLSNAEAYPTYQDVIAQPHMAHLDIDNNPYVKNSVWLNEMFNLDQTDDKYGERRRINGEPVALDIINFNGLKVSQEQGASDGSTTTNLWIGDKLVQDFNSLLTSGTKEMMRAGDKASAFAVRLDGFRQITGRPTVLPVRIEDFVQGFGGIQSNTIFTGYLIDELTRMQRARFENIGADLDYYNKSSKEFNLFRDILPETLKTKLESDLKSDTDVNSLVLGIQKEFKDALRTFFNKQVDDKVKSFNNYQFNINQQASWIDQGLRNQYEVGQLIRAYVVNALILNVEQTKVFNGDGAFYKAFHKRNSKDSSTGTTMMTDTWFIDWLNQNPNANLQAKLLGVTNEITNVTNTVVFKDNIVASAYIDTYRAQLAELNMPKEQIEDIVSKYSLANEGDAQGWITLDFYRTFKLSQGKWYAAHEAIYEKASKGEALTSDELFYFMPIKAQYAGPLKYNGVFAPAFHKFSLVPLIPSVVKGTKMESMNEKMLRNNIGYGLFESGSKVATILNEQGNKDSFYKDYGTREAVDANEAFTALNPVFNHYLKEQVNIDPSLHDEVIFGTQFRKLLFQNLFNEGKEIDNDPKWEKLYNEYSNALEQLVFNEKQRLLEELGMEETKDGYKNVDFTKLVDKFIKEAKRRDMNDNVQSFMQYDEETKGFKYPLDASTNRQQIQNMIMSMINNRLVRQHMKGDLMVQVSGAGFEKYTKPTDAQVSQYGSNGLRFYHLKDGKTQAMQVKVPLTGDFANLVHFLHTDGKAIGTIDRLNDMLKHDQWMTDNRKAITMIGYRIPTQGLNSIEFMEVAEFLPPEAGNIMILPTEVVIKNGGDFDIDKLSIFKPSIRTRTRGKQTTASYTEPKFISLKTSITTQKEQADLKYKPELLDLRNQLTKISDDKFQDTRYLYELRNKLKTDLNTDVSDLFDKLMTLNHDKKYLEIEIAFKRDDVDMLLKELDVVGINDEIASQLTVAKSDLRELNQAFNTNRELINQARVNINTAKGVKAGLLDSAETIISNYMNNFYVSFGMVNDKYQEVYNEYKNKLEDLYAFKGGIQNRIIEIGNEVLQDKANFAQLITPNDTGLIKPMITDEGGIKQKNGYPLKTDYTGTSIYTEKTQEEKFLAGLVGKKALGIAAVNNTFTQLFQQINLHVEGSYVMPNRGPVKTYIRLLEQQTGKDFNFSETLDEKGVLKSEFISQMINAYVDVLNDDFIFYANAGLDVAPILFYMKNAGVSTEKMFYFINHPAIKYFINNTQATKSHILKATNPQYYDTNFRPEMSGSFKNQMFKALVGSPKSKIVDVRTSANRDADSNPNFFTEAYLKNQMSKDVSRISYTERSAILGHFLQLQEQADLLRKFQAANSYDTSTAPNPVASANFNVLAEEVTESKFIKPEYQKAMSNTVIKAYNVTEFVSSMFDNLMPTTFSRKMVDYMLTADDQVQDRDKFTRLFTNDLLTYIFSNYVNLTGLKGQPTPYDYINGTADYASQNKLTSVKDNGETKQVDSRLSKRIKILKNNAALESLRTEYPIIDALRVQEVRKGDGFTNITIYRGENTTDTQNSLIEQFSKLANLDDPKYKADQQLYVRKLFRDLALYGFLQSGLNKSPISFTDIIPNELYTPLITKGLEAFQNDIKARGFKQVMDEYNLKFIQNNPELFGNQSSIASYRSKNYRDSSIKLSQSDSLTAIPKVEVKSVENRITAKQLEDNPRFFYDAHINTDVDNLTNLIESNLLHLDRITMDNYKRALALNAKFGEMIFDSQNNISNLDFNTNIDEAESPIMFYGKLDNSQENRIFNSRNVTTDKEVDDVLSRMEEQSKPCNV